MAKEMYTTQYSTQILLTIWSQIDLTHYQHQKYHVSSADCTGCLILNSERIFQFNLLPIDKTVLN